MQGCRGNDKMRHTNDHGRFVLNTYSNKNKWLDTVRRVTKGNNKQKQIVNNEWHGIPGIRNKELRLEQIYRVRTISRRRKRKNSASAHFRWYRDPQICLIHFDPAIALHDGRLMLGTNR
jgi:hypothetical protein